MPFDVPPEFNRGPSTLRDNAALDANATFLIRDTTEKLGLQDLSGTEVLDVGCGTKFTRAFLDHDIPIKRYVGVDVHREMIEFLQRHVDDRRFEYHHVDIHNERYNPDGRQMTEDMDLGVGGGTFDVIWLFSVFTHLAPHDYPVMLRLLRRYVRPDGRLFYTVFINERTESGFGFIDQLARAMGERLEEAGDGPTVPEEAQEVEPFVDLDPAHPLRCAMYSRAHAIELVEGTGWQIVDVLPPTEFAQHQIICTPV